MSEHKYLTDEEIVGLYLSCPPVAKPLRADLAAYRAELKAAQEENGRMRTALEDARKWLYASELIAVKPLISDLDRALNPQPAQYKTPETPWSPSSLYNGYEERINGNGHLETRPLATQPEKP